MTNINTGGISRAGTSFACLVIALCAAALPARAVPIASYATFAATPSVFFSFSAPADSLSFQLTRLTLPVAGGFAAGAASYAAVQPSFSGGGWGIDHDARISVAAHEPGGRAFAFSRQEAFFTITNVSGGDLELPFHWVYELNAPSEAEGSGRLALYWDVFFSIGGFESGELARVENCDPRTGATEACSNFYDNNVEDFIFPIAAGETFSGYSIINISALAAVPVAEPSALALILSATGALAIYLRRRHSAAMDGRAWGTGAIFLSKGDGRMARHPAPRPGSWRR
jgi:hypothetical protein